ncbi:MAG: hypothetical protein U0Q12_06110 [Vicinamibacterales bacterium]
MHRSSIVVLQGLTPRLDPDMRAASVADFSAAATTAAALRRCESGRNRQFLLERLLHDLHRVSDRLFELRGRRLMSDAEYSRLVELARRAAGSVRQARRDDDIGRR